MAIVHTIDDISLFWQVQFHVKFPAEQFCLRDYVRKTARNARKCDIFEFYIGADAQNAEGNKTKYFTNFKKRTMPIFIILAPLSSAFGISQVRTKKNGCRTV